MNLDIWEIGIMALLPFLGVVTSSNHPMRTDYCLFEYRVGGQKMICFMVCSGMQRTLWNGKTSGIPGIYTRRQKAK